MGSIQVMQFTIAGITNVQSTTADGITFNTPVESRFNNIEDGVFYVEELMPIILN